jgi:hypothetical protein
MNQKKALEKGYTHHGVYRSIPVWLRFNFGFEIAAKWAPLEPLLKILVKKNIRRPGSHNISIGGAIAK